MGHKSKFTFPIPGWRKQPTEVSATSVPLTKAQKILGTGGINTESSKVPRGQVRQQPWDSRSGISISISESSASHTTGDTGLGIVDEEDDATVGTSYGENGWDAESDILPRQLRNGGGLRTQRSAATIGNDYRTDASSLQRRQSNASTIYSHYDRNKVPLSISQQTSNSAMAKGLPNKANSLLDMDGSLAGPGGKKKKPSRLDLSMLKPRSRRDRDQNSQAAALLGNNYVTRSPSFISQSSSPYETPRKLRKSPSMASTGTHGSPLGLQDSTTLSQLYDHYEQMSFRSAPSPGEAEEEGEQEQQQQQHVERSRIDSVGGQPTPPLTTSSTHSLLTPTSNLVVREPNRHRGHFRKDSAGSRNTITSTSSPGLAPSNHLSPVGDCASSISSRNTRTSKTSKTSKTSRTLDSDLQTNSVLSLSDSDSDDGTFSDSAPKSSMSSHTNMSHEDVSLLGDVRKAAPTRPPAVQERSSSRQKQNNFAPLNDYLAVPASANKGRVPSNSTLRSFSSSGSTATATGNSNSESGRASRLSVSTTNTADFPMPPVSHKKQPHSKPVAQEAKAVTLMPLASTAEALDSLRELTAQASDHPRRTLSSDQLTPPLSPSSMASYVSSPGRRDNAHNDETAEAHNARLMAVTKQEEMLLAALRQKRAMMRENILAEIENGDKGTVASRRTSSGSAGRDSYIPGGTAKTSSRPSSQAPQLPPFPSRQSSLVSSFKSLTERKDSVRRTDNNVRFADEAESLGHSDPIEKRSSSAMSNATIRDNNLVGRHERVLMFLDRPLNDIGAIDAAEPSPDLSEFMDYDQDSDGEIVPERRRSRRNSRVNSGYGFPTSASRRGGESPRADLNLLGSRGTSLKRQLENLPESNFENNDEEADIDFDGFSDVMSPPQPEIPAAERSKEHGIARPDSPVEQPSGRQHTKGHVKGKNSAVRLSAVGNVGSFLPPEAGLWGDDG
ncbi:hypothetical protein SCUP234_08713 [Seiridium cupressi]